jgi:small-conductance mechanosensitive channel
MNDLLIFGVLILSILVLRFVVFRLYKARKNISTNDNFIIGINTISFIVIASILFLSFLALIDVNVKQFFTSISIIAAAIAILSKDYFSNAINGMILMFNSHINIDDYVRIGDVKGKITHLTLMNVHLVNEEGDLVLIPNNLVLATQIVNYTKGETRKAQLELPLSPAMAIDIAQTELLFKEAIKDLNHKAIISSFNIRIIAIEKDAVVVKLALLLHENDAETEKEVRRKWLSKWAQLKKSLN